MQEDCELISKCKALYLRDSGITGLGVPGSPEVSSWRHPCPMDAVGPVDLGSVLWFVSRCSTLLLIEMVLRRPRNGSSVKSMFCSCRALEFSSQRPCQAVPSHWQLPLQCIRNLLLSSVDTCTLGQAGACSCACVNTCTRARTHTNTLKMRWIFKKEKWLLNSLPWLGSVARELTLWCLFMSKKMCVMCHRGRLES